MPNDEIIIGNESSVINIDIYCHPDTDDTFFIFQNIIPIIDNFSNYVKFSFYFTPLKNSQPSNVLTQLLYTISNMNLDQNQMTKVLKFILNTDKNQFRLLTDSPFDVVLDSYTKVIQNGLGISADELKQKYHDKTPKTEEFNKIRSLPTICFNSIEVRPDALKTFFIGNKDYVIKVASRKSDRSYRKNKDKKGLQTYSKLYFGTDNAMIQLDLYFDPMDSKSSNLIGQVSTILSKYSDLTQVILHPTATSEPFSSQMVRLILAAKNIEISKGINFIYWLCLHKNEMLQNTNNNDENQIVSSIINRANREVQIDRSTLLLNYLKSETFAETLGSTFDLKLEKIKSLPYAKVNGYSIDFNEQDEMSLYKIFNEFVQVPDDDMKFNKEL